MKLGMRAALVVALVSDGVSVSHGQLIVEPGSVTYFRSCAYDRITNAPLPGYTTFFNTYVNPYSGWHLHHDALRPRGDAYPPSAVTGSSGCVAEDIAYYAPLISGDHSIRGDIAYPGSIPSEFYMRVMVQGLQPLPDPAYFDGVPSYTKPFPQPDHGPADWGLPHMFPRIDAFSGSFNLRFGKSLNLARLSTPWGGINDIGGFRWTAPLPGEGHANGDEVDILVPDVGPSPFQPGPTLEGLIYATGCYPQTAYYGIAYHATCPRANRLR